MESALGFQGQSGVRGTEGSTAASVQTRKASAWRRWQALRCRQMTNWAVFKVADNGCLVDIRHHLAVCTAVYNIYHKNQSTNMYSVL